MTTVEQILEVATQFEKVGCEFAFLGGAVLQVLVTDQGAAPIRVTKDVDVLVNTPTRISYTKLEAKLRRGGFKNDTSEGAPLCRYIFKDIVVDVMPTTSDVLGWESKWFVEALATAEVHLVGGRPIKALLAPYYLATKIDAFEGRGKRDFLCSQDFEDIVCLVNGRDEIIDEVRRAPHELRLFLENKIRTWFQDDELQNAIEGFLVTENEPEERMSTILRRFRSMANMKQSV